MMKSKAILIFGTVVDSGKTVTSLGLLQALQSQQRHSLFYLRLNNQLKDYQSIKKFYPQIQLLKDEASLFKEALPEPTIVETDGGVLSLRNGLPQAHQLMTKYWESASTILVGDSGSKQGVSNSLLAYEALANRDFKVQSILFYPKSLSESANTKILSKFVNVPVIDIKKPPEQKDDPLLDYTNTMVWLEETADKFKMIALL